MVKPTISHTFNLFSKFCIKHIFSNETLSVWKLITAFTLSILNVLSLKFREVFKHPLFFKIIFRNIKAYSYLLQNRHVFLPIPRSERSKARVWGRSLAGIAGSNPAGDMDVCLLYVLCVVR